MDSTWLDDFLALAETGSFGRAAARRQMTQPAFSRRIRSLEHWAGTQLVDRSSHQISLTASGLAFRPAAEEVRRRLLEGRDQAQDAARVASGSIGLACTHMLAATFFGTWLAGIEPGLPGKSSFQLLVDNMEACERLMRSGTMRLLLCHHHDAAPAELDRRAFITTFLGADCLVPVSTPNGNGQPRYGLPAVAGQSTAYLAYRQESGLGRILRLSGTLDGLPGQLEPVFHSHAALTLASLARAGRGLAWVPMSLVREDLETGKLVLASDQPGIDIRVCLIRPAARQSSVVERLWSLASSNA
jgi:DNA-binding transcriptional LysR family regulator